MIDTPSARERHGIPPGQWRTPIDPTQPAAAGRAPRPAAAHPHPERRHDDAHDAATTSAPRRPQASTSRASSSLSGDGGGRWVLRIADERCNVRPGVARSARPHGAMRRHAVPRHPPRRGEPAVGPPHRRHSPRGAKKALPGVSPAVSGGAAGLDPPPSGLAPEASLAEVAARTVIGRRQRSKLGGAGPCRPGRRSLGRPG